MSMGGLGLGILVGLGLIAINQLYGGSFAGIICAYVLGVGHILLLNEVK